MDTTRIDPVSAGRSVTLIGAAANAFLIIFKLLAGVFGKSHALIADGIHSISDLFTDAVVLFGLKVGRKPPDEKHHFGHARIETLSSAIVGLALIVTALYLGAQSAWDIYRHTVYHPTALALAGAIVSIAVKEALYHYTVYTGRRIKSQLVLANAWHHRSDALSSVAVLIGVGGSLINPSWYLLDAFAALVVSFFIIKVGLEILAKTVREFTDTAPPIEILDKISTCTLNVEGVVDSHDLRVRTSGGLYQVEIHIVVDGQLSVAQGHRIAKAVEHCLAEEVDDLDRIIVHVDPVGDENTD
jgi:cation diffusion facilitator family transporter